MYHFLYHYRCWTFTGSLLHQKGGHHQGPTRSKMNFSGRIYGPGASRVVCEYSSMEVLPCLQPRGVETTPSVSAALRHAFCVWRHIQDARSTRQLSVGELVTTGLLHHVCVARQRTINTACVTAVYRVQVHWCVFVYHMTEHLYKQCSSTCIVSPHYSLMPSSVHVHPVLTVSTRVVKAGLAVAGEV